MKNKLIAHLLERVETDKDESDFAYFFALLLASEAIAKVIVLGLLAALDDDTESNRYRVAHRLVRANGLGDWSDALQDVLSGPASQFLIHDAHRDRNQLTRKGKKGEWQYEAVTSLQKTLTILSIKGEPVQTRADMTSWFRQFATLRNKTRGHGAPRPAQCGYAAAFLADSIKSISDNLFLFEREWVYLHRSLSGKYRVSRITDVSEAFDYLRSERNHSLPDGVYVHFGSHRLVPLIESNPDLSDYFLPNGGFRDSTFELLSYVTDNRKTCDSTPFLTPPHLHLSETHGHGELVQKGNTLSNAPDCTEGYVARPELEAELFQLLMDDRRPVVTMQGAGGVGKTSSTLQVIDRVAREDRYWMIVWFSARDIDLLPAGPKTVKAGIFTPNDVANKYAQFVLSVRDLSDRGFDKLLFFQRQLGESADGHTLFVFDNFETVQNPLEMFRWIDNFIRVPNKVLITTRLRSFKGDYPLEVRGMSAKEAKTLIDQTSARLGIQRFLTASNVNDILTASGGHPYVIKILLGEVANKDEFGSAREVIAGSEEILTALFERTFATLTPCAQRGFMTLAAWNSAVPRIALEAVLMMSTKERYEVEKSIDALLQYSLAEERVSDDRQEYIFLPWVASAFGRGKLQISLHKPSIEADVQILHMFGPSATTRVNLSLRHGMRNFIRNISERIDDGGSFSAYEPILNMVCRTYNPGWLQLAEWRLERGGDDDLDLAIANIQSFLQGDRNGAGSADAWRVLADVYRRKNNVLGELHAFVERAQYGSIPFYDLSNTANLLNRKFRELDFDDGRRQLAHRLLVAMEGRIHEAGPDDYSRMAWLALHISQEGKAKALAESGLKLDPENIYCQRIASRIGSNPDGSV